MSMRRFFDWMDRDFENVRPLSMVLIYGLVAFPLGLAFAFEASPTVIEAARAFALIGVIVATIYYLFRQSKNVSRIFKSTFGSGKDQN